MAGMDVAGERYAVAELEMESIGQVAADHAGCTLVYKRLLLVFGNVEFTIEREELFRLHAEAGELVLGVAGILIGAAKPVGEHHFLHAGNALDSRLVSLRNPDRQ